jgi:hypothetical protein
VRVYLSLALFAMTAVATALLSSAALAGTAPAAVLLERALLSPEDP